MLGIAARYQTLDTHCLDMNDTSTHPGETNLRVAGRRSSADVPRRFRNILCLDDFEEPARRFLPRPIFGYVVGRRGDQLGP